MRYYLPYLFTLILSSPALAAETFIAAPTMDVTVTATTVLPVCNVSVAQEITLPDTHISQFAAGGVLNALTPTDYSGGDIYTPFNITLTNCGSETASISRTMRLTLRNIGAGPIIDGVFSDYLQNSTNVGIVILIRMAPAQEMSCWMKLYSLIKLLRIVNKSSISRRVFRKWATVKVASQADCMQRKFP